MDQAVARAFEQYGAPVLGGPSGDGWSKQADLQRCPYRYYLMHEKGVVLPGPTAPPLEIGILWHAALACHYHRLLPAGYPGYHPNTPSPDQLLDAVEAVGAELANVTAARRLVWGYLEHWPLDDVQPVALEYPAGVAGVHTCRYDMVGWHDDELWVFEHKSAAKETEDLMDAWFLDGEVLGEMYGWRLSQLDAVFGARLTGVIINIGFKSNPPRYRRLKVVVPEVVIRQYIRDRAFWNAERESYRATGYWPRKLQGCLSRYNDVCGFFPHCRDGNDLVQLGGPDADYQG